MLKTDEKDTALDNSVHTPKQSNGSLLAEHSLTKILLLTFSWSRTRSKKKLQQFSLLSIRPSPRTSDLSPAIMSSMSSSLNRSGTSPTFKKVLKGRDCGNLYNSKINTNELQASASLSILEKHLYLDWFLMAKRSLTSIIVKLM